MPVSIDDPFLLASFSSTTQRHQQQRAVSCTPEGGDIAHNREDDSSSLLVVAIQGEGLQLFNTADQKCVLSYSTPPGYSFTGSAQTLYKSDKLRNVYAVVAKGTDVPAKEEGKVVWMWKDESSAVAQTTASSSENAMEEDVVKSSSARKTVHKFDRKIHQLFVSSLLPNHVVLTNVDGSISLVTEDLKRVVVTSDIHATSETKSSKKEKKDSNAQDQTYTAAWAIAYNTTGSWIPSTALAHNTLVIMTIVESGAGKVAATLSYVNEEQRGFTKFGQVEIDTTAGSSGFAFDVRTGQLSFMTTTGQLKIYDFEVSQGDHIVTATETLNLPLPGYATAATATPSTKAIKKTGKTAVDIDTTVQRVDTVALGDNYLAVSGIHQGDGKTEQTLTIWDIKYGTLQAKHILPGTFSAENTTCQLALLPDSVLVMTISILNNSTVKSDIYLCHFYAEPMSLLGAMGRMKESAPFLGQSGSIAQDAYTSTTTSLLVLSDIKSIVKGSELSDDLHHLEEHLGAAHTAEKKALMALTSESKTSNVKSFETAFFKHVEQQAAEAVNDMMKRFGVDANEAKEAVEAVEKKKAEVKKQLQYQQQQQQQQLKSRKGGVSQDMDIDTEPVVKTDTSNVDLDKIARKKLKKKAAKAAKAAAKEADQGSKEAVAKEGTKVASKDSLKKSKTAAKAAATKAAKEEKVVDDGSSSESSSDEDDDEADKNEVVVLSSDDEAKADEEEEEEPEYELDAEEERVRMEEYQTALEEWRKIEAEAIKNYRAQRRLLTAGRKQVPPPELSHHFVTTVVGRCFNTLPNGQPDMSFWPGKVIEYLIEHQLVGNANPGAGQAGIALNLMEREQWSLLELALKKLYDIPEMDMVVMLKQVIGMNKNKAQSSSTVTVSGSTESLSNTASSAASAVPTVPHFLKLIMIAPKNEIFMQQAIKRLTVEELSVVLEIMKSWIDIWDERGGLGHQKQPADRKQLPGGLPGYGLIVDFTTMVMDVHFPLLILSPHLHPVLKAIQTSVQRETQISNELEKALRGPLALFDRKHREMVRRQREATVAGVVASTSQGIITAAGGVAADKRRRRKWEGGEGIPDYGVEIIHL
ncbi:hypothetical protein EDD11_008260 [Mortierella claussenii]|nr:hypothetical protein EDD11_008260 [Mortierella claussenii]